MARKKTARKAAKKPAKKPAPKAAKTAAKKTPRKVSNKAPARRAPRTAAAVAGPNPGPISTGRGPSPREIGQDLVAMFNAGQLVEIEEKYWSPDIVSIEGFGAEMAWSGRDKVLEKNQGWIDTHNVHGAAAEGPYVGASGFAVKFRMDVEDKTTGKREMLEEVGVYTVRDGKIIREEFMYHVPG